MSAEEARPQDWSRRPERSNAFLLKVMTWIALRLGRRTARLVLHPISAYFLLFAGPAGRASRDYLTRVLGRPPRLAERYAHIHTFAATVLDRVYLINERFDLFQVEVEGEEHIRRAIASGRGVLLMGGHLGSFEVMRALGRRATGLRVAMVMYEENARRINAALAAINPAAVQDIIPLGQLDSMLLVRERLEQGCLVGLLADRAPGETAFSQHDFLGAPAPLPDGPWRMAALLGFPVLFMAGCCEGDGRYRIHFEPLGDFSDLPRAQRREAIAAAQGAYVAALERHCRATPMNWFNFFDFWQQETR